MRRLSCCCFGMLLLGLLLGSATSSAELNLYVSYHFAGMDCDDTGSYQNAAVVLESALKETKKNYRRGDTLDGLGQVYTALGQFGKAEECYRKALGAKRCWIIRRRRDLAKTRNNLADLLYIQSKMDDVETLYRKALNFNRRDQLNIEVCRSLNGLALVHNDKGEYVEAEKLLLRAVAVHERAERRDHPYLATVLTNLGILYTNLQRYAEAEPMFERAKYIQDRSLRDDHPDVALRLHATAALYQATGRVAEATLLAQRADAVRAQQTAAGDLY